MNTPCPFCNIAPDRIVEENSLAVAILDNYPVSEGHTLIVPREHSATLFELSAQTQAAIWQLVGEVRHALNLELTATGFNFGLNDGRAAGQTVMHAHVHVIPRYKDDVPDPRGGIRWVIPDKAKYWTK